MKFSLKGQLKRETKADQYLPRSNLGEKEMNIEFELSLRMMKTL